MAVVSTPSESARVSRGGGVLPSVWKTEEHGPARGTQPSALAALPSLRLPAPEGSESYAFSGGSGRGAMVKRFCLTAFQIVSPALEKISFTLQPSLTRMYNRSNNTVFDALLGFVFYSPKKKAVHTYRLVTTH